MGDTEFMYMSRLDENMEHQKREKQEYLKKKKSKLMIIATKITGWMSIFAFAAILALLIVGLMSCNNHCETCTQTITANKHVTGYPATTTFEACGDDLKSLDGKVFKSTSGTLTITTKIECQ